MKRPNRIAGALCLLTVVLLTVVAGCIGPAPTEPAPRLPIDLAPRCAEIEAAPPLSPATSRPARDTEVGDLVPWSLPGGAWGAWIPTPRATHERISWGFPVLGETHTPFDLELAAGLLRLGASAAAPESLRRRSDLLGARRVVRVEDDWVWLEMSYPPERQASALSLFGEWIDLRPASADEFERARRAARLATLAVESAATHLADQGLEAILAGPRPERAGPDTRPDAFHTWMTSWLRPAHSVVLHASASNPSQPERAGASVPRAISALIEEAGAGGTIEVRARTRDEPPAPVVTRARPPAPIHVVDRKGAPQVEILVGFATVATDHPDAPALEMLASLLGGNVGGRLFRDLRERQGLAYIIDADQSADGRFAVSTRARPERVGALLAGIEAHLRALVDVPLLDCEHAMLARRMAGEEALRRDEPEALHATLRQEVAARGRPRSSRERSERYAGVQPGDLALAAERHLAVEPTIVLVGDARGLRRSLARALPGREVRLIDLR